ncbi:alpha/beta hydrolase family protein [Paraglaciecola aestuariivivens]
MITSLFLASTSHADLLSQAIETSQASKVAPLIPRSQLTQTQYVTNQNLSPDGLYLTYILNKPKHSELWLLDINQNQHRMLFSSKSMDQAFWSKDSQFLFVENKQGVKGISIQANAFALLITQIDESKDQYFYGVDNSHPQAIIISEKDFKTNQHQLIRISSQGVKQVLHNSSKRVLDFILDDAGKVTFIKQQVTQAAALFDIRTGKANLIKHCDWFDKCALQAFDKQKNTLLVKARFEQDLTALWAIHIPSLTTNLLHQDPKGKFDLTKVYYDQLGNPRLALYQDQFYSQYALDTASQRQLLLLQSQLASYSQPHTVWLFKASANFKVWMALDVSSNKPEHALYLFDMQSKKLTQPLAPIYTNDKNALQQIAAKLLLPKVAIEYQVSDGMWQFGYVTLPLGKKINQVPIVVKPHGGPWSRVTGDFDQLTQLLANRGYAVFEPNFRASTGMGKNYVLSANKDFGNGRVQQDIIDGLDYLLSKGVGDRDSLAIYGHSFGGFSTLAALAFTPDLFKVGIAGAPPADIAQSVKLLRQQAKSDDQLFGQLTVNNLALDPDDELAMQRFYAKSPDDHWQNIKKPIYILAGGKDHKVSIAKVKDFSLRLNQANKPISLLVDDLEGHSPKREIAREGYFYVLEKALATHLKSDYQQSLSPQLNLYLKRHIVLDNNALLPK